MGFREGQEERLDGSHVAGVPWPKRLLAPRFSSTRLFNRKLSAQPFTLTYPRFRVRISGCSGSVGPSQRRLNGALRPSRIAGHPEGLGQGEKIGRVFGAKGDRLPSVLEPELPNVAVIAAHELSVGTAVTTIGRIEVA